jgi:O-antigen ligase
LHDLIRIARWSLAATVAAMPLYVVRWHYGPIPTTLLENLILITIGLYIACLISSRKPMPRRTPLDIPIAIFLVAGVIGIFVASDHRGALGIFRAYLLEPIAIYYIAVALLTTAAAIETVLAAWSVGAVLFAATDVFVLAREYVENRAVPGHLATVLGINPNSVAIYIEPLIAIAAAFAIWGRGRRRWIAVGVLVVLGAGELATLSRGGLLALAVLVLGAGLTIPAPWPRVAVLAGGLAASLLLTQVPLIGPRLQHALDPGSGTFDIRGDIWAATARMLRDHPIFGAGIDAYQSTMAPYRAPYPQLTPAPYPHNIFLTSWSELGLLGLAAFTYILGFLIVRPFRAFARAVDPFQRALLWGTGMAFVVILVHGLVDSPYWKNDLSLEFWVLAAIQASAFTLMGAKPKA